jgi:prepilin-type N-terminal cleavage/methylation domain-containing protein
MSHQVKKSSGFTLIELLVVISIIALLLGILVPVLGVAKKNANIMKESVNLRNIHAALATYGTSNKDWFTGYTASGKIAGVAGSVTADFIGKYYAASTNAASATAATTLTADTTAYAQAVLMDEGGSTPAQWVSPGETNVTGGNTAVTHTSGTVLEAAATKGTVAATTAATDNSTTGMVSVFNSSFAVLAYGGTLKAEWKSNQNQQAIVMASRMIGDTAAAFDTGVGASFNSVWTDDNGGSYKGSLVRGDTSTATETFKRTDLELPFATLKYGSVAGTASTATPNIVGPFGHVTVITGGTAAYSSNTIIGAIVASGAFTSGQIVSGLN